jgi:hypothetical protein
VAVPKVKILIVDSYYPDAIKALPFDPRDTYENNLAAIMHESFGTADFYSRNLRALGWDAIDVIANHQRLQLRWLSEHPRYDRPSMDRAIVHCQIHANRPDIIFAQDLSFFSIAELRQLGENYALAAQLSCPWPGDDRVRLFHVIFTSFPHYVPRIEALGVKAVYLPLAFDPIVLERVGDVPKERIHDVVFIGGVGNPSHWKRGMETLEHVAREIPTFKWWGYGVETLPANSALRSKYQGQAFGLDMYRILLQSKICLNRHGEVARGYTNNMRCFEATGCGALLLTENSVNLGELFGEDECLYYESPFDAPWDAVRHIKEYLHYDEDRKRIAAAGQKRTLRDHTYAQRMRVVSDVLKSMLRKSELPEPYASNVNV